MAVYQSLLGIPIRSILHLVGPYHYVIIDNVLDSNRPRIACFDAFPRFCGYVEQTAPTNGKRGVWANKCFRFVLIDVNRVGIYRSPVKYTSCEEAAQAMCRRIRKIVKPT